MTLLWTDSRILHLIEEYKKRPCLWDPCDEYNKIVSKKNDAWCEIAFELQCDVPEIKRKVASLLASFRRERKREGSSTWYAFNQLSFLLGKFQKKSSLEDGEDNSTEWWTEHDGMTDEPELLPVDDKSEVQIDTKENLTLQYIQTNPLSDGDDNITPSVLRRSLPPRKKQKLERTIEYSTNGDCSSGNHQRRDAPKSKSVNELFIAYLAAKMDTYSDYEKNIVQHKINDVLFQADIGTFAKPPKDNENS